MFVWGHEVNWSDDIVKCQAICRWHAELYQSFTTFDHATYQEECPVLEPEQFMDEEHLVEAELEQHGDDIGEQKKALRFCNHSEVSFGWRHIPSSVSRLGVLLDSLLILSFYMEAPSINSFYHLCFHVGEHWPDIGYTHLCNLAAGLYQCNIFGHEKPTAFRKHQLVHNFAVLFLSNTSTSALSSVPYIGFPQNIESSSPSQPLPSSCSMAWLRVSRRYDSNLPVL